MNRVVFKLKVYSIYRLSAWFGTAWSRFTLRANGDTYGKNLRVNGILRVYGWGGTVKIGDHVLINSSRWSNPIGAGDRTEVNLKGGTLSIGNHVGISNSAFCVQEKIVIEDEVAIGGGCCIYDTDFHSMVPGRRLLDRGEAKPVIVHKGAFIGANCIILKGTEIGENAVIGAGSVVAGKKIGPNEIWAGNPAKFIKMLDV